MYIRNPVPIERLIFMRNIILLLSLLLSLGASAQEICDNAIDDDLDGLIDLNDTLDCACESLYVPQQILNVIPNPSFELQSCCPSTYSEMECVDDWAQAIRPTPDYIDPCDFMPAVAITPFPEGSRIVGTFFITDWPEYFAVDLSGPLLAGTTYDLVFQIAGRSCMGDLDSLCAFYGGPVDVTLFGFQNAFTYMEIYECPVSYGWQEVGSFLYDPSPVWQQKSISFTPTFNMNSMMIGPPCNLPPSYPVLGVGNGCSPYFMYDDLKLYSGTTNAVIEQSGDYCLNDLALIAPASDTGSFQWYLDGVALLGETDSVLNVSSNNYGIGEYTFRQSTQDTCAVAHITVSQLCDSSAVPTNSGSILTECSGLLLDDGAFGPYSANSNGWTTIAPANAESITLEFSEFDFLLNQDYLNIYDGPDVNAPLISSSTGSGISSLPNNGVITSSGGAITIEQETGSDLPKPNGFELSWSCLSTHLAGNEKKVIKIWPNPASNEISIQMGTLDQFEYELIDLLGRTVLFGAMPKGSEVFNLNVAEISKGVFLLKIHSNATYFTQQIIIK